MEIFKYFALLVFALAWLQAGYSSLEVDCRSWLNEMYKKNELFDDQVLERGLSVAYVCAYMIFGFVIWITVHLVRRDEDALRSPVFLSKDVMADHNTFVKMKVMKAREKMRSPLEYYFKTGNGNPFESLDVKGYSVPEFLTNGD